MSHPAEFVLFANRFHQEGCGRSGLISRELAKSSRLLFLNPQQTTFRPLPPGQCPPPAVSASELPFETKTVTGIDTLVPPRTLPGRNYAPIHHLASHLLARWLRPRLDAWRTPGLPLVALVQTPAAWDVAKRLPHDLLVYDAHDAWHLIPPNRARLIDSIERSAARSADLVLASSASLATRLRIFGAAPLDLPNACDPSVWYADDPVPEPEILRDVPRPRFLFFGGIDDAFDLDAVVAAVRAIPDAGWILLGDGSHAPALRERLRPFPHVRMPGTVPYTELPVFAAHCDVCLLPYKRTERNDARDTVKLYEYLATGNPIAANPIAQTRRFPDLLALNGEGTPGGFAEACRQALGMNSPSTEIARRAMGQRHSWENRGACLLRFVEALHAERT